MRKLDLFPLFNSLRISILSTIIVFFTGLGIAYYTSKTSNVIKGILDCVLTLPLVLPPTVIGFMLLMILSPKGTIGDFMLSKFNIKLVMVWQSSIFSTSVVSFPLMYRAARSSFENFDENVADCARCLGIDSFRIFWRIRVPYCRNGLTAGAILSFARGLGEYGATSMVSGYIPNRTSTISTTVYQLWQTNNETLAVKWIIINILISLIVLIAINIFEKRNFRRIK